MDRTKSDVLRRCIEIGQRRPELKDRLGEFYQQGSFEEPFDAEGAWLRIDAMLEATTIVDVSDIY